MAPSVRGAAPTANPLARLARRTFERTRAQRPRRRTCHSTRTPAVLAVAPESSTSVGVGGLIVLRKTDTVEPR